MRWFKLDDVELESERWVDRRRAANHDDPATGPSRPDGGGRDDVRAARVDERQPSEVEHDQSSVALGPADRASKFRRRGATKLTGHIQHGDLAAAILEVADKSLGPAGGQVETNEFGKRSALQV